MTDTTDIAALRVEIAELRLQIAKACNNWIPEIKVHPKLLEKLLDKLEAERQQREELGKHIANLEIRLRFTQETLIASSDLLSATEKKRDDLKSAHSNMVARCALLRQRTDLPVDRIPAYNALVKAQEEIAVLREKLANPVVLPAGYSARAGHPFHEGERNVMIPNKHGDWLSRFDVEHAINLAGFSSTIGEE